jgi:diguanylate cyclase (GGDEF)-like protein
VYATSVHTMLQSDSAKAQAALPIANSYLENHPLKNSEDEEETAEYDAAASFVASLTSYLENPSENTLELASIPNDMAKEILQLDSERLATAEKAMNAIESGTSYSVIEDDYYKVYMPIQFSEATNPWSVAVSIPMSEVLKASSDIQRNLIITFIIAILAIAGILFLIANSITKPIKNLTEAAGQFGKGNFDAELSVGKENDEIGILSQAFKDMAERIKSLIGELQNNAQELEENIDRLNYLNETLVATNHVSEIILNAEHQQFQEVLKQSLELLGKSVDAEGVFLWQNSKLDDGKVYSKVISSWVSGRDNQSALESTVVDLDAYLACWNTRLQRKDGSVLAALDGGAIIENFEAFRDFNSLVMIPLLLNDSYWGFLAISYPEDDYELKSDESEILRSSGMMLASAILQNETSESLKDAEAMASTDPLTGLMNRNGFLMRAPGVYAECRSSQLPLSILFFDIDYFKRVNDKYGHPFGDEVLKAFSEVLKDETGEENVSCRYGGEEFLLLMKNSDLAAGKEWADQILEKVRRIRFPECPEFSFTVSIGMMTGIPGMHDTLNGYIQKADDALYRAKNNGRDQMVISSD